MNSQRVLKVRNYIGYGVTDFFGGGAFAIIAAWLMYFFTNFCGLTPIEAGSILFIAKIVDTFASPIVGYLTDNFGNTYLGRKFGRRRFFILLGCPLVYIYSLLWISNMHYWYYLLMYLLIEILAAIVIIPWETLASEMTDDYAERSKLSAVRIFCSGIGTWLATFLPGRLFAYYGTQDSNVFFINGLIFSVIFMSIFLFTYFTTWESKYVESQKNIKRKNNHIKQVFVDLISTLKLKCFRQHLSMYVLSFTSLDLFYSVFVYFIIFSLHKTSVFASDLLSVGILLTGWSNVLLAWWVIKFGQTKCLTLCYVVCILCFAAFSAFYFWTPVFMIPCLYIISIVYQFVKGGYVYIIWNIYPFIPDIDELVTTKRREGVFAGMMTVTRKSTSALSAMVIGIVLQYADFIPNSNVQSETAIAGITSLFFFGNVILLLLSMVIALKFKLTKENHQLVKDEISRLKSGGKLTDTPEATKHVIYQLTGIKHEKLWSSPQ